MTYISILRDFAVLMTSLNIWMLLSEILFFWRLNGRGYERHSQGRPIAEVYQCIILKMYKEVEMTCRKVCKQVRDDNSDGKVTKPYLYIFLHHICNLVWKWFRDEVLYICLHYYIIPTLFAYFLVCHPYIFDVLFLWFFNVNLSYSYTEA